MVVLPVQDLKPWTMDEVLASLPRPNVPMLPAPAYTYKPSVVCAGLAVESMKRHMTDEGWQIFQALEHAGCVLCGHRLTVNEVDVPTILEQVKPGVVFVQDKREWEPQHTRGTGRSYRLDGEDEAARFRNYRILSTRPDVFKLTLIKDVEFEPEWNANIAKDIGCHAWITYYNPRLVCHLGTYIRPQHLIRTWHSLDKNLVPPYSPEGRGGCSLSGALSRHYPFRQRLVNNLVGLPETTFLRHPGYHRNGCETPKFMKYLTGFKVAIVTCTAYAFALRKFPEATACGCRIITNLPIDEHLPEIDDNLIRVHPNISIPDMAKVIRWAIDTYDPAFQEHMAKKATEWYDYRPMGIQLARDIEHMRRTYQQ